ncbi:MAG: alanine--tRNA ligase [Dehalococcoidales bacterium]|nr:MAG: alanine--tRNA ligase [Dehalococcoidales bacterium]
MTSDEIREAFLKYYENKDHSRVASSSLIPHGDPTLLLTSAGMVQMKPYFLGDETPSNKRLTSCQKCFRTTDIDEVGDTSHLTFFEMLGNFSVGDYFKKETIEWTYDFVTEILKIPHDMIWATVYLDDDESFEYWRGVGLSETKIHRFNDEENFWGPAGDSGPCGPDNEVFFDRGEEYGCGKPDCKPNCTCDRFLEICTLVFMQYNQAPDGSRTLLPAPSVDTGMGLERVASIMQGVDSIYQTDLYTPIIDKVSELTGEKYGSSEETDNAIRVVAEHSRGITFLIADGVIPSNEGRGYVLRRLLRRAALYGLKLGMEKPFLFETAGVIIDRMSHIYPELKNRQDFITKVIRLEEEKFRETLQTGLELIESIFSDKTDEISGKDVFRLYDTYGFPVELTDEVAAGKGISVDIDGFEKEMEKQREKGRAAQKLDISQKNGPIDELDIKDTVFTGYTTLVQQSTILAMLAENDSTDMVQEGQEAGIILADTPFYGEMGGQLGDTGEICSRTGRFIVSNTVRISPDVIMHRGKMIEGSFAISDEIEAKVNTERRLDIARNHTATHLLQAALRSVLGEHIQQRGSLVAPDYFRFDFSHLTAMMPEEIAEVQRVVNEGIRANLPVYDEEVSYAQAITEGAIAIFDEKYADVVRVLKVGKPPKSMELCGGTHVSSTGEIGFFRITSESSIGSGLRRIEAVTGRSAEEYINRRINDLEKIAGFLETETDETVDKTRNLLNDLKDETRRVKALESELASKTAESLVESVVEVDGVNVIAAKVKSSRIEVLREISDILREKLKSVVIVLGSVYDDRPVFVAAVTPDLVTRGYNAGGIIKQVAQVAGGGGGGKPDLAQAGGKQKEKLDDALSLVAEIIRNTGSSKG